MEISDKFVKEFITYSSIIYKYRLNKIIFKNRNNIILKTHFLSTESPCLFNITWQLINSELIFSTPFYMNFWFWSHLQAEIISWYLLFVTDFMSFFHTMSLSHQTKQTKVLQTKFGKCAPGTATNIHTLVIVQTLIQD